MTDDEQVRRLLADARHTEPMPDDVAARLDGVLADLRDEPVAPPAVDELAARRRRRTARGWLLAAAAVVVVGVGIDHVDWSGIGSGQDGSASSAGGDSMVVAEDGAGAAETPAAPSPQDRDATRWRQPRLSLTHQSFGREVESFRTSNLERYAALADTPLNGLDDGGAAADYSPLCDAGDLGAGALVPVRYDGERAWLVIRKPQGETQVVDLYLCGGDRPTRSITLPAP